MTTLLIGHENGAPITLHYEDHGDGPPVILIHGWPLSGRSWEAQVPALIGAGYRVITYDRRGFGQSSQPWTGYDYDTFAADLNTLIEHLSLTDITLVGFSMGGGEVARYIGKYGTSRIAKAVLAGAVTPYLYRSTDHPDGAMDDATLEGMQAAAAADRIAFVDGFATDFFRAGARTDLVSEPFRAYNRDIASLASPKGTIDCIAAFGRTDFRADLAAFTIPTLIIHGDSDAIVPFEISGRRAHESIEGSRLVLIEGGPHGMNATHSKEFNDALIGFLRDELEPAAASAERVGATR